MTDYQLLLKDEELHIHQINCLVSHKPVFCLNLMIEITTIKVLC